MAWQVPGYRHRLALDGDAGRLVLAEEDVSGEVVVIKHLDDESAALAGAAIEDLNALPPDYFVRIRKFAEHDGHAAIVMDAVNGVTLRELIRDHGGLGVEAAMLLYRDVLAGLAYAHALDITHGEIAPENVLVDADGRPVMTNTGALRWRPREVTLSSGVYLAPERWSEPPSAAGDIYAATTMFIETLAGEPPFWEESDIATLRWRHDEEDVALDAVPSALHDVVRVGMAKRAESRLEAAPLLELVETVAIAEYGRDWKDRGRALVMQRIELLSLPFGAMAGVDTTERVRDTEDVANDDFYRDAEPSTTGTAEDGTAADANAEPAVAPNTDRAADDADAADADSPVVVAASEILELARLRDAAAAAAMAAASVEEELTEEEEAAVAEIERLIGLDRPESAPAAAGPATDANATSETGSAPDAAAAADSGDTEAVAAEAVAAEAVEGDLESVAAEAGESNAIEATAADAVTVEAEAADAVAAEAPATEAVDAAAVDAQAFEVDAADAGTFDASVTEAVAVEAVEAEAFDADGVPIGAVEEVVGAEVVEVEPAAVGVAAVPGGPAAVLSHRSGGAFYRRHPWWTGAGVVVLAAAIVGIALWATAGPTHHPTPTAQVSTVPANIGPGTLPSGGSGPGGGAGGGPSAGGGPAPSASAPTGAPSPSASSPAPTSVSPSPQPTLPATGLLHPIRAMAAVAFGFLLIGGVLMYAGRRRDDLPTGSQTPRT